MSAPDNPQKSTAGENVELKKGENRRTAGVPLIESLSSHKPPQPVYYEGRPVSPPLPAPPKKDNK
jgi:hypothetical protein